MFEKDIQFIKEHTEGHVDCLDCKTYGQMTIEQAINLISQKGRELEEFLFAKSITTLDDETWTEKTITTFDDNVFVIDPSETEYQ